MNKLKTMYMGIELNNPIIIGASNLLTDIDNQKKAGELGAGAIVYKSLFEEQIQLENFQLDEKLNEFNDLNAVNTETWLKYSKLIAETGVDGIELNFYQIPMDFNLSAKDVEQAQINTLK